MRDTLTVILAGGRGLRLEPLTRDRAKPAVPFGGLYRIVDFVLSNCLNSGMPTMLCSCQRKPVGIGFITTMERGPFLWELQKLLKRG